MSATAAMTVAGLAAYAMYKTLGARADPSATRRDLADAAQEYVEAALAEAPLAGPEPGFQRSVGSVYQAVCQEPLEDAGSEFADLAHLYAGAHSDRPTDERPLGKGDREVLAAVYARFVKLREHPDLPFKEPAFEIKDETDPLEAKAKEKGLNYVKLDGQVGIIGNGAGLVMSTLDVVAYAGEAHGGVKPANFLDIGGGANAKVMADGLDVILNDEQVKSVFVNVFGGITACDEVANGIKGALEILGDEENKPLVVRLDGNNVEKGRAILEELDHPLVTVVDTMDGAADKAAELANK